MAISRQKKEQLVEEYVTQLNDSKALIITEYRGLTVPEIQELRGKVREAEGTFTVVKNTLVRRALQEAGLPIADDLFTGPVAIGFCHTNIPAVAKAVTDFAKNNDALTVKGGYMGESVVDEKVIQELASLPSLDVLRAQLLGVINAPATQLTSVIAGGVRQLVNVFNAYAEKEAEPAEA